jgi:hypothetical protein
MADLKFLPPYPPLPEPVVPRQAINRVAPRAPVALQLAAENAPLRITYGRDRIGAQIACVLPYGSTWVIQAVWGEGEIDAVSSIEIDNATPAAGITLTHYVGTAGQTADATLIAAWAAQRPAVTYADALPGIAYSVIKIPNSLIDSMPQITAIVRGRKLYDPRTTTTVWSANPALALADLLSNATYGAGRTVDWASVEDAADACDALVGSAARRAIGLTLDAPQPIDAWVEALRAYAGCFVIDGDSGVKLVADRPVASSASIAHASGQILRLRRLSKRGARQTPTVVEVVWTDTGANPWRSRSAYAYADGVLSGPTPRRESQVQMPGIQSAAQAAREAIERLNKLTLQDLTCELDVFDQSLALEVGDVVTVTHPVGLTAKAFRVTGISGELGRFSLALAEYDASAYSDAVESDPTSDDTDLPSPSAPPAPTGLTVTEEVYQLETGLYASRIAATWDADTWPYRVQWSVALTAAGVTIATGSTLLPVWRSGPLQEGVTYQVEVRQLSIVGTYSTEATADLTAAGKALIPGNVASLTGFEAGGICFLGWSAAVDLDIWRYELRYGLTSGSWDTATVIDRIDGLTFTAQTIPPGSWRFYVKAIDSVGQYSTTAATLDLTVTSDVNSFLVDRYEQTAPTLTNVSSYALNRYDGITHYVTEDAVAAGTKYSSTMSSYTAALATYHSSLSSEWLGEAEDFGADLSGDWTGESTAAALSGTVTAEIGTKTAAAGAYAYAGALTAKTTARFARLRHQAATTSTLYVRSGQYVRLNAVPREEVGTGTSSASAAVTVSLTGKYSAAKKLTITPEGNTARIGLYDNIVLSPTGTNSFDVHVFDAAGARMASTFRYAFQGL